MATLTRALPYVVSAGGQLSAGRSARHQLYRQAASERAAAQRKAVGDREDAMLLHSRALAVAAASGAGGLQDPTISKLLSDIDARGEYNALSALWEGREGSGQLRAQGLASNREGTSRAMSTILSSGGSMAGKYG